MQLFVFQSHSPQPPDNIFGLLWRSIAKCIEYKARKANPFDCEKLKYRRLLLYFFLEIPSILFALFCSGISVSSNIQENTVEELISGNLIYRYIDRDMFLENLFLNCSREQQHKVRMYWLMWRVYTVCRD